MGDGATVALLTLDQAILVRIQVPQNPNILLIDSYARVVKLVALTFINVKNSINIEVSAAPERIYI